MKSFIILAASICVLGLAGCAQKSVGYRTYSEDVEVNEDSEGNPQAIEFYISTLDSIKPYIHVFPTGVRTEAPNLDPRFFCPPESTMLWCKETVSTADTVKPYLSLPKVEFEVIGEVETTLDLLKSKQTSGGYAADYGPVPLKDQEIPGYEGPNKKLYRDLPFVDWQKGFDNLRESAATINADAVIEIFCAEGVSSFWYPPVTNYNATYGPDGKVIGSYSTSTPGGIGLTGWKLMGLAVRWKE